jgi:NADH dehydrogenase
MLQFIQNAIRRYGSVIWNFPLRLMVAWFWLDEAGAKMWGESKWSPKNLTSGLGEDSWLVDESVKMPFEWLQTATSGASAAADGTEAAPTIPPLLDSMPGWFEAIMKLMMPTPEVAILMQKMVVFVELFIGIGILLGLFTWLFSLVSVGMLVTFTLSAMLGIDKFMALPASIALMNGSGRFLGLDYYIMPMLDRWIDKRLHGSVVSKKNQVS